MNNPLEAVTQAVNSLVTALKLPDESAKANEVLGEMSFPQFSRLLPYRDYNQESGLFMNDTTMGFMLEAIPINGANESIVEALDHMLRTKLPRGIPLCIHLMSSQLVGDRIEYGLREFSWSGEQAERFNAITRAYYMKAAATQFPLPEGMNLPLTLRHYPHVQPDRQYHALLPVYFFLDTRWSDFMGKNKLADVCERLYLLVVYHAGRHAGFNQVPASI